ncbi:MAG TPA: histone deacetylase [Edaphocola sp.]|nr:histone deacetylase [Edaphocola sp.]
MHAPAIPFIARHPLYTHPLPEGHRFPMLKYELLPEQLLLEGVVSARDFFSPEVLDRRCLAGSHRAEYTGRLFSLSLSRQEARRIGFPLSPQLLERELRIAQGTVDAARAAILCGIGFNIAGGTHHAGAGWGEGFCLLNDQAIAANCLLRDTGIQKVLIIDLDVHQGNGTADIFKEEPRVFTFSMHGRNNFPFKKETSDWDIGLPDGIQGDGYLELLADALEKLFVRVRAEFVFFQAGVDVLASDKMGKLRLSIEDCRQRDILVFEFCRQHRLPVQVSMGGGYSPRIKDIVDAHCHTYKEGISRLLKT